VLLVVLAVVFGAGINRWVAVGAVCQTRSTQHTGWRIEDHAHHINCTGIGFMMRDWFDACQ
jgi:hypothetical protein